MFFHLPAFYIEPRYSDTPSVLISLWCAGLFCAVLTLAVTVYNVRRHYESAREQGLGRLGAVQSRHPWIQPTIFDCPIEGQRRLSWLNARNMSEECHICHIIASMHHITSCFMFFFLFRTQIRLFFGWLPACSNVFQRAEAP